jgi:adenylate kinase family enzyme
LVHDKGDGHRKRWRRQIDDVPSAQRRAELAAHEALLSQERWLIDGYGSWSSVLRRISTADTIIFVDHPIRIHFWWATKRQVKSIFVGRPDGPEGCPMFPVTIRLFKMMWRLHRETRPKLIAAIETRRGLARIIYIRSPRQLAEFASNPV